MNIKTMTTVNGVNVVDFGDTTDRYYWCKNIGETDLYVSTNAACTPNGDGTAILPAGEAVRLESYNSKVYVRGTGKIEVHESNSAICSFKRKQKGGETSAITPEKLGYAAGAKLFFDGIYNYVTKHVNNGAAWLNMIDYDLIRRYLVDTGKLLIGSDHYIKETGADSALRIPVYFNSDHFTTELFFEITDGNTSENDIINNFDHGGFGLFTENNAIQFGIFNNSSNAYQYINGGSYEQNTKYHIVVTYNGENVIFYVNGTIVGSEILALADYKKSNVYPYIGCVGGGGTYYSAGAYKFYRVAYYERALSQIEILNNYNADITRFNV